MKSILQVILAFALLLGGGVAEWTPSLNGAASHECCCGMAAGGEDACPCPKPERSRTPQPGSCQQRAGAVALQAPRRGEQAQRRVEAAPVPADWAATQPLLQNLPERVSFLGGRDPDLGRHLALLRLIRI